jgi:hypothetical protein
MEKIAKARKSLLNIRRDCGKRRVTKESDMLLQYFLIVKIKVIVVTIPFSNEF